jgi:hypothetical protein
MCCEIGHDEGIRSNGMIISGGDDAKDGFLGCMGQHDYEVCSHSVRFSVKLIGGLSDAFLPHEGFVRGIHYRRTYFYSVSKVSLLCFVKPKRRDRWWVFVLDRLA